MTNGIFYTDEDLDAVVRTLGGEARGEEYLGQVGVVWVFRNRFTINPGYWGQSLERVCRRPYQFSCWNGHPDDNHDLRWMLDLRRNSPGYQRLKTISETVLKGSLGDPTFGCTFYKRPEAKFSWAKTALVPRVVIGNHQFFALDKDGNELPDPRKQGSSDGLTATGSPARSA